MRLVDLIAELPELRFPGFHRLHVLHVGGALTEPATSATLIESECHRLIAYFNDHEQIREDTKPRLLRYLVANNHRSADIKSAVAYARTSVTRARSTGLLGKRGHKYK